MSTSHPCLHCAIFALIVFSFHVPLSAQSNYAIEFDGVDDHISMLVNTDYYDAPGFTWEMWFNIKSFPPGWNVLLCFIDGGNMEDLALGFGFRGTGNQLAFEVDGLGGGGAAMTPITYMPTGGWPFDEWFHVAAVRDFVTDSVKMYIDGELVAEAAFAGLPINRNLCNESGIGYGFQDCNHPTWYFHGALDDVRIWNRARQPDEIKRDMYSLLNGNENGLVAYWPFEEGTGSVTEDRTAGANHGTLNNGSSWIPSTISPPVPPISPSNLSATPYSPTKIQLSWSDQSNNETRFIIEKESAGMVWNVVDSVDANIITAIIDELSPSTEHFFRVKAVNPYFSSGYTNVASATTPEFIGPADLTATPFSSAAILLQWSDKTSYETAFVIEMQGAGGIWYPKDTAMTNSTAHLVGQLEASTEYTFRVKALEGGISSPFTNTASATTLIFLEVPTNLTAVAASETEVELLWTDNSEEESGFEIEQRVNTGSWTLAHTTDPNQTQHAFTQLTPRTEYFYRVRAVGDNAASSYSNIAHVVTRLPPHAPENFSAVAAAHDVVRLQWERGSENEDNFEIERRTTGAQWIIAHTVAAATTSIDDEALEAETTYWYRIRATNDVGVSDWTSEEEVTTLKLPIPDSPFGLMATATGPSSIALTWVMPDPSYEAGFELEESLTGDEGDFTAVIPSPGAGARTFHRKGLEPETTYYYRLRAVNSSGTSVYSKIVHATTLRKDERIPVTPFSVIASALSESKIRITWSMPDSCIAEAFSIERSRSGDEKDFQILNNVLPGTSRTYADSLLWPETTYYYRLRAYNVHGTSEYSDIASATTSTEPLSPELVAAMDSKEALIPSLERLFNETDENLQTLRDLFGSYPLGYVEAPARTLMSDWRSQQPSGVGTAVEAMQRYTLVERAMYDATGLSGIEPSIPGAEAIAHQVALAPSVCVKDLLALAIAWDNERALLPASEQLCLDKMMSDLSFALFDGAATLFSLTANPSLQQLTETYANIVQHQGDVRTLEPTVLLSTTAYFKEAIIALKYLPATQAIISDYAGVTRSRLYRGSQQSADAKYRDFLDDLRTATMDRTEQFKDYKSICQGMDRAYSIHTTESPILSAFARKLTVLKPSLCNAVFRGITNVSVPVSSMLYLSDTKGSPGASTLPAALENAASSIFDPTEGILPAVENSLRKGTRTAAPLIDKKVLDDDRTALLALRSKVLEKDDSFVSENYDEIRRQGKRSIASLNQWQRWLGGIEPSLIMQSPEQSASYYSAQAQLHRAKALRSVLSVSLADFMLDIQDYKIQPLVAEIDSIIGWMYEAADAAERELNEVQDLVTAPLLVIENAWLTGRPDDGAKRYRLVLEVQNVGHATAQDGMMELHILEGAAEMFSSSTCELDEISTQASMQLSLDLDIESSTEYLTIGTTLTASGALPFTDIRVLSVPEISTDITERVYPTHISLDANFPNPFNPSTHIAFTLNKPMRITLVVTDALGREVARPIHGEERNGGEHIVVFDGHGLPGGVYLYRLESENTVLARRMLLLR